MSTITYDEIYSNFFSNVEAYDLTNILDETKVYNLMDEWLRSIKSNPRVRKLFSSILLDSTQREINYSISVSLGDEDSDNDYIISLFGLGISWKWVTPKYYSVLNSSQMLSGKEVKFYSQANHMSELEKMYKSSKLEFYNMIKDYGVRYNNYLSGDEES